MTSEGAPDSAKSGGEALVRCLQRVAHHHRAPATLQSLTAGLPTTLNDFTPDLLVRAAKRAGLKARLQSLDIQSIPESALPAIVLLQDDQCAVLESLGVDGSVSVYRPELGSEPVVLSMTELQSEATGTVLFARPKFRLAESPLGAGVVPRRRTDYRNRG